MPEAPDPLEEQKLPPEFADTLYDNVFRIWANPEIERRKAVRELPEDYKPWAVQVYMEPTIPNQVRFDSEVNGVFLTSPTASLPEGETISPLNFHRIARDTVAFELGDDDSANAGHITIIRHKEGFYLAFDFNYNTARIADHIQTAREFLDGAEVSHAHGLLRVFVANLYHAVELLAKSSLFKLGHKALIESNSHKHVRSQYNLHTRSGITDPRFAPLLNDLADLRNKARYPDRPFSLDATKAEEMLVAAEKMYESVLSQSHPRTQRLVKREVS